MFMIHITINNCPSLSRTEQFSGCVTVIAKDWKKKLERLAFLADLFMSHLESFSNQEYSFIHPNTPEFYHHNK